MKSIPDSESASSRLTSSDKLSALPLPSSSSLTRVRGPVRAFRRSLDPSSSSLPSIHSSPGIASQQLQPSVSRGAESDSSVGHDTPQQRVSFDSDRGSLPATLQGIRQAIVGRHGTRSDSAVASVHTDSPALGAHAQRPNASPRKDEQHTPLSRSPTPSRAASPLRLFGFNLHRTHSRDEPFIPVDPFQSRLRWFSSPSSTPQRRPLELDVECRDTFATCLPLPIQCTNTNSRLNVWTANIGIFFTDTLPRQLYLHILLRLPSLYFSRVARIFEDAEVSKHEIGRMIQMCAPVDDTQQSNGRFGRGAGYATPPISVGGSNPAPRRTDTLPPYPEEWIPPAVSPALYRFKHSWEQFVDSLLKEWKTLNLVSALLCTAILTMFQVPDAAGDPLTRWAAILSLICALMSLTYGCVYIVQFGTMRSMYKASRWAEEAQRTKTVIWWNIWVLLATPAIWLAWSMISFCVSILSYVWRTGAEDDPEDGIRPPLNPTVALAIRVVVTVIFGLGLLYFALIMRTFSTYGEREAGRRGRLGGMAFKSPAFSGLGDREARTGMDQERDPAFRGRSRTDDRGRSPDFKDNPSTALGLGLSFDVSATRLGPLKEVGSDTNSFEKDNQKISPKL
ncbi:unnamed protein product [Somion occarium]